ncbi:MAG TPA: hypothetical protein VN088_08545 [Nocardioides sp.]|nr:hypothetical protein [Nocardioides sp.]
MANELLHPDPAGMSAEEHIAEAERLLSVLGMGKVGQALERAQVHATLAVAKQLKNDA